MVEADRYKDTIRWRSKGVTETVMQTPVEEASRFILDVKAGKFDHLIKDDAYVSPFE